MLFHAFQLHISALLRWRKFLPLPDSVHILLQYSLGRRIESHGGHGEDGRAHGRSAKMMNLMRECDFGNQILIRAHLHHSSEVLTSQNYH